MESAKEDKKQPASNREIALAKQEFIDSLVSGCTSEEDLFGRDGVFTKLKGAVMERLLEAEMAEHLGHEKQERRRSTNARNGYSSKTVQTDTGPVGICVPRDREGTFDPKLVKKHQRRLEGFDEKVIALYARGMTTRDIQQHLRELYGTEVSPELISRATDGRLPIIGVGGILDVESAAEKLDVGATLVQIYTGMIYGGPNFVRDVLEYLQKYGD